MAGLAPSPQQSGRQAQSFEQLLAVSPEEAPWRTGVSCHPVDGLLDVLRTPLRQVAKGVTNVFELRLRPKWRRSSPAEGLPPPSRKGLVLNPDWTMIGSSSRVMVWERGY